MTIRPPSKAANGGFWRSAKSFGPTVIRRLPQSNRSRGRTWRIFTSKGSTHRISLWQSPGIYLVDKDVNQGRVAMMLPGIMRDDPDYFAVTVMNDILGGGGFTSRIVNRVRSDEGLAYDAHTSFPGGVYYPLTFTAAFQSKSRTVPYAASLVLEEIKGLAAAPVSDGELDTSKRG